MFKQRSVFFAFLVWMFCAPVVGQQASTTVPSVQRDPQAMAILAQALRAGGGVSALSAIQDYTAMGTATFYWAGEEIQGTVTVKGRGTKQLRIDATLPDGVWTWSTDGQGGFERRADGTVLQIPPQVIPGAGSFIHPLALLLAALQDSSTAISYVGLEVKDGSQVHHLRLGKAIVPATDPSGMVRQSMTRDMFIDSVTFQVRSIQGIAVSRDMAGAPFVQETQYANYQTVQGVLVPFLITNLISGQRTHTILLNQISFNGNLSDHDFEP